MATQVILSAEGLRVGAVSQPDRQPGTVTIRPLYTGLCGSDIHAYKDRGNLKDKRCFLGHEIVGRIVNDDDLPEKVVVICPLVHDDYCNACAEDDIPPQLCKTSSFLGSAETAGSFGGYLQVPAENCMDIPFDLDPKVGALFEPVAVSLHALKFIREPPSTVAIIGGGPIGALMALLIRSRFPSTYVVVSEPSLFRHDVLRKLGVLVTQPCVLNDVITKETRGRGVDLVVEAAWATDDSIAQSVDVLRPRGTLLILGIPCSPFIVMPQRLTRRKEITVHYSTRSSLAEMVDASQYIQQNVVLMSTMINSVEPIHSAADVFARVAIKNLFMKTLFLHD